jgi:ectoine hydroxylase-related dioxygenase (phytanoyl-CoA dioxygenase family)
MIYLTDCRRDSGALRVHPWSSTRQLLRAGFFDRFDTGAYGDRLERGWVALEGRAGAVILWNSNIVHKATPPTERLRDAVAFKFLPSPEPWRAHLARMGERVSREYRSNSADEYFDPYND